MGPSRWATREALVAKRWSVASSPIAAANWACQSDSVPHATWMGEVAVRKSPYGAIAAWWLPCAFGYLAPDRPASALEGVHPDQRPRAGTCEPRARGRWVRPLVQGGHDAVRAVHAGQQVGDRNPDLRGLLGPGDEHQPALALGDLVVARSLRLGPVVAEPLIDSTTSRGFSSRSRATEKPSRSSTPTRKFSISTSALATSRASTSASAGSFRSRTRDSLLRFADMKYVDSRSASVAEERRPPATRVVAAGRLDLDDPGAQVAEHHACVWTGERTGQVEDEQVGQRAGHAGNLYRDRRTWVLELSAGDGWLDP